MLATGDLLITDSDLELVTGTEEEARKKEEKSTDTEAMDSKKTYDVDVKVVDEDGNPLAGVTVTLHSEPKTAITDENGVAHFKGVEEGEHRIVIAQDGYEGEQSIQLSGDVKKFSLNIQTQRKNIIFSTTSILIITALLVLNVIFVTLLIKSKKAK